MEGRSYISCIKINGVPILPPMMTKDVKEEMSNYKQIAINIEKRLAAAHVAEEHDNNINTGAVRKETIALKHRKRIYNSKESLISFEYKNVDSNESNVTTINSVLTDTFESPIENGDKISQWNKSDTEYKFQCQINPTSSICSKPESISTVITNHCLNLVTSAKSSTSETVSEILKPQVPKTLNIIPLTLSNSNCEGDEKYQRNDLNSSGDAPKLVRQGSYVLDTPSPILLAHMQMELSSSTSNPCSEYVPTSCTNTVRRKEWNIAQAKIEWENESKSKEFVPVESFKRNSYSNTNPKICKSISLQTKPDSFFVAYPGTRSVDCIQTMLANENVDRSNAQINYNKQYAMDQNGEKKHRFKKWKKYSSSSTFQSAYKCGGSLENLTRTDVPFSKYTENEHNKIFISNNFTKEVSSNKETEDTISNLKSSIASDKLLTVYKKVQEMHKKQMFELMSRQQREQTQLQKEFEKQQLLLLTEIRKSFPKISVPFLSESILSTAFNQVTSNGEKFNENIEHSRQNIKTLECNLQQENEVGHLQDNNASMIPCPLDYICPEMNLSNREPCSPKHSHLNDCESLCNINNSVTTVRRKNTETQLNNKIHEKKFVEEGCGWKRLNVSRQLFPLDSQTIHVPVLDRTIYGAKHTEAANVINAYTRGYLVRRMMRTERVIALKKTYKEALHCMLKLHVDAPLNRSEISFLHRLQLQCDAASMNIVELFAQSPEKRMQVIAQDREFKQSRIERPMSARSYSFATQRTLARKKLKEMEEYQPTTFARSCLSRSRCQTWTSDVKEKLISPNILYHSIKRSTSAGTVRKPWR